jgi:hypothetical protein
LQVQRNKNAAESRRTNENVPCVFALQRPRDHDITSAKGTLMLQDSLALMPLWAFAVAFGVTLVAGFVKGSIGFAMPLDHDLRGCPFHRSADRHRRDHPADRPVEFSAGDPLRLVRDESHRAGILALHLDRLPRYRGRGAIRGERADADLLPDPWHPGRHPVADPAFWRAVSHTRGPRRLAEWSVGLVAGALGGLTGTWGPPTVLYLIALETPKAKQILVQGVVYGLGSVSLLVGHIQSGVLNMTTLPFSAALLIPAFLGMQLGFRMSDRLNPGPVPQGDADRPDRGRRQPRPARDHGLGAAFRM